MKTISIDRRAVLMGLAGVCLPLPRLQAMGKEVTESQPKRFCALYTANGMCLPNPRTRSMIGVGFPPRRDAILNSTSQRCPSARFVIN